MSTRSQTEPPAWAEEIVNRLERAEDAVGLDEGFTEDDVQYVTNSTMGERVPEGAGDGDARNRGTDDGEIDFTGDASLMGE